MFNEERMVADGTILFAVYDEDDPEKKPILKLDSKRTARVITALLNADREQISRFSLACMDAAKGVKNAGGGQGNLQIAFFANCNFCR